MESYYYIALLLGAIICAYRAMLAQRILSATLYLACVSAFVSVIIYLLGAPQVAVIELSVGAGLVTVLMVYALSVVGEDARDPISVISKPLAFVFVTGLTLLLGWLAASVAIRASGSGAVDLANSLWADRILDVWIQIALIFSGVMGILGLLSEKSPETHPAPAAGEQA